LKNPIKKRINEINEKKEYPTKRSIIMVKLLRELSVSKFFKRYSKKFGKRYQIEITKPQERLIQ